MRNKERIFDRERGQMSLAMVVLSMAVLAIGVMILIIGQATDARGKAQKAADSAALAAADETRTWWSRAWLVSQTPPKTPAQLNPRYPSHSTPLGLALTSANTLTHNPASDFADRNDSSTVDSLWAYPNPMNLNGAIHISVDTLSEQTEVVGTADRDIGTPQGTADAVAEVRIKDGITCQKYPIYAKAVLVTWSLNCWDSEGNNAWAQYVGPTSIPIPIAIDNFTDFFEVRLVNNLNL